MRRFTELVVKSVQEIDFAFASIHKIKAAEIESRIIEVDRLENEADVVLNEAVADLFKTNDAISIIKLKEIYELMETITDKCEDVVQVIRDIILEYSYVRSSMATVIVPVGIVILVILVALFFDFLNGFHDAANSVATIVSTRVLSPRIAVLWAAFFNFVAAFVFGVNVASTIGKGTIDPAIVTAWLLLSTLIGAITWDIITWWFGLPTSSSHALVGGLIGAGVVKGGWGVVQVAGVSKIILFIALSPLIGLLLAIGLIL